MPGLPWAATVASLLPLVASLQGFQIPTPQGVCPLLREMPGEDGKIAGLIWNLWDLKVVTAPSTS